MAIRISIAIFFLMFSACKEKEATHGGDKRGANKLGECETGGGVLNQDTKNCDCPASQKWETNRCVVDDVLTAKNKCESSAGSWKSAACKCPAGQTLVDQSCVVKEKTIKELKAACLNDDGEWNKDAESCDCPSGTKWLEATCKKSEDTTSITDALKSACTKADGEYVKKDAICLCPDKKVLVKEKCSTLTAIGESDCSAALSPGKWTDNRCACEKEDAIFSLPRGGCIVPGKTTVTSLESMCGNSLNKGTWSEKEERCDCGSGKIWHEELCQDDSELSDRQICNSDFNSGRWDSTKKLCKCKVGFVWQSERCLALSNVDEKLACESDVNLGKWDLSLKTCLCPNKKGWVKSVKQCAEGVQTAAQALCIQSGGNPGTSAGSCVCGTGLKVKVLAPQNFQYCVKDDKEEVPLWLLILLGLVAG